MIVCHCNRIEDGEIQQCCLSLLSADPWIMVTATAVYEGLGKRPRCGGCLTLATSIIQACVTECRAACDARPHAAAATSMRDDTALPTQVRTCDRTELYLT